jgi:hypothetical protein
MKFELETSLATQKHALEMEKLRAEIQKQAVTAAVDVAHRQETHMADTEAAREALRAGRITAVLHYSRRASETFAALAAGAGLDAGASANWAKVRHIALSPDVAEPLLSAGFSHIAVAPQPDEDHLLDLVAPAQDGVDQPGADPAGGADDRVAHGVSDAEAAASGSAAVRAPVSRAPVSRATSRVRQAGAPPARSSEASRAIVSDAAIGPAHDAGPALPDAPDPPYGGASPEPTASASICNRPKAKLGSRLMAKRPSGVFCANKSCILVRYIDHLNS